MPRLQRRRRSSKGAGVAHVVGLEGGDGAGPGRGDEREAASEELAQNRRLLLAEPCTPLQDFILQYWPYFLSHSHK